jgi:hypothetical protein
MIVLQLLAGLIAVFAGKGKVRNQEVQLAGPAGPVHSGGVPAELQMALSNFCSSVSGSRGGLHCRSGPVGSLAVRR